jgi:tRNA dimethylallyltransferase
MIKQDTRHFAKRQLTWFRREPSVTWVDFSQIRREDALSYMLEQLKEKEII